MGKENRSKIIKVETSSASLLDIGSAIYGVLDEIVGETLQGVEYALDKAAEHMKQQLENNTPIGKTGKTKQSWKISQKKARSKRDNTKMVSSSRTISNERLNDKGIPVVNLLEFGSKGKPFVRKTVAENEDRVLEIMQEEINKMLD